MPVLEVGSPTLGGTNSAGISVGRTVTAGSKSITIQLSYYNGSGAVAPPTLDWDGESIPPTVQSANALGGNDRRSAVYFLANPAAGSHTLTGTFTASVDWKIAIREWENATDYHDATAANGDSGTPAVNINNVVTGEVVLDAVTGSALTVGAGQNTTGSYNGVLTGSINGAASIDDTSVGVVSMNWTQSSSTWAICGLALVEDKAVSVAWLTA